MTLQALQAQDLYLLMASLVMGAVLLIAGNLIADLMLKAADPRIRLKISISHLSFVIGLIPLSPSPSPCCPKFITWCAQKLTVII